MKSTKFLWGLTFVAALLVVAVFLQPMLLAILPIALYLGALAIGDHFGVLRILGVPSRFGQAGEAATAVELKALEKAMNKVFEDMGVNLKKAQEVADNALAESKRLGGVIEGTTHDKLTEIDKHRLKLQTEAVELRGQVLDLAQKIGTMPQGGSGEDQKSVHEIIVESDSWKANAGKSNPIKMDPVSIPSLHYQPGRYFNTPVFNPNPYSNDNPLVPAQRVPGLIVPPEQRLYIRDLIPQAKATSNLIEFASEASFTNNAGAQGDTSPVGHGEGEMKKESAFTFTLASAPVVVIAHWIPASRQVLSDASFLQGHLSGRLVYGVKLKEESDLLTSDGGAGKVQGINNAAAAFSHGVTNQTALDTMLKSLLQVSLSNFEASGFVLHPVDWFAMMLLKDTQGRYLFSDPQSMVAPRLWSKPVVSTQSQTLGRFTAGAFSMGCQIWDKEDVTIRISENVNDHFIRNMVAILVEERLALTIYRSSAFVTGVISQAG